MDRPWQAFYDPGVPTSIDYPQITLPELFDRTVREFPDRIATIFAGRKLHYRDLRQQVDSFAAGLVSLGIRPGERVALMLPNVPQFVIAFYGILTAGAVVVPTNPLYTPHELEHQLSDCGATAIVTLDQTFPKVQSALTATRIRTVICAGIGEALPLQLQPLYRIKSRRDGVHAIKPGGIVHRFEELLACPSKPPSGTRNADDLAVLQYTGGTTGRSKGAMLSHRNLVSNALMAYHWQGSDRVTHEARILCVAPFFHVYGMTVGMNLSVAAGATMLLVPRFVAQEVAATARKHKPDFFPGVPTIFVALANLPGVSHRHFGSLRTCISGAAPLPPDVQSRFETISGVTLVEGYGLTEASPVTHCNPFGPGHRAGTIGVPWPDTDATITDPETWEVLPPGTVGELTVRGPQVMMGYWNRPEETAQVLRNGWLHTGDLGRCDGDGFFTIVDRKKDLIIAGGYNIYPREVEDVLYSHPKVLEAAVVGVPSDYRGETVKAFVVLQPDQRADAEEIMAHCRTHLAPYKVPKMVEFRDDLPKSLIGKILRRELRTETDSTAGQHRERPVA